MARNDGTITIDPLKRGRLTLRLIGETPLYFNAMSAKAKRDLLLGGKRKTAAERAGTLKHDPVQEFRNSVYSAADGPTLLAFPAPGIKQAMATSAIVTAGVTKTAIQRMIFLPQQRVPVWGLPFLKMDVVRSADMNRTPDIRTRAFLPRWATEIEIAYISPNLSPHSIVSLLQNAGITCGIGDFRQEKGRGSFGTFYVAGTAEDMGAHADAWAEMQAEGRAAQAAAMQAAEPYDDDTAQLLAMVEEERNLRLVS